MSQLITTEEELQSLCDRLMNEPVVAVDTEFFWERTFYPILGLVQLAVSDGTCWLLDTVRLPNIYPLGAVLNAPGVVKLLHDAQQDLTILVRATSSAGTVCCPKNIFDTRLAAGFAGLPSILSLKSLLESVLDIHLPKTETRSNWIRRPLSAEQLSYAADDVLYLPRLREVLLARCKDDSVRGWLAEEQAKYDDPALYAERNPQEMWQRVKGRGRVLSPRDPRHAVLPKENGKICPQRFLALLREIAAWREREARRRDWPRAHVLDDAALIELALARPADAQAFFAIPCMPRRMPEEIVRDVLDAVRTGGEIPLEDCPKEEETSPEQRRDVRPKCDKILASMTDACAPYGIDPAILASRDHLEQSFLRNTPNPLETGWRRCLMDSKGPERE